jgi:1-acyl-sn-glycerol-3-phosphate acyltransferase
VQADLSPPRPRRLGLPARAFAAIPLIAASTLSLGALAILAGLVDRRGRTPRALGRAWARFVLCALGVRVVVRGAERVGLGAAVYAANHGSALDIPILLARLPVDFRMLHKSSLSRVPVLGWSLRFAGHIAIDRRHPFRARRSLATAGRRLREGASLAVFPEGTRSPDPEVRPFKRGSFVLAIEAGVPVVPITLDGVKRVVPRGIRTLRPGTVRMTIHAPIETRGREVSSALALAEEVRRIVAAGCEEG